MYLMFHYAITYLIRKACLFHFFYFYWAFFMPYGQLWGKTTSMPASYEPLKSAWQGPECSPVQWRHRRLVQNYSRSPTIRTQSLVITLPKKGNLQLCQKYRTISLNSHPSKVMLKIILNRLQPQAEEIIAEEQAGFRAGKSTTEQILNLRILCEKYLEHQ